MKFTCEKYLLLAAVNTASRAVATKSPIPSLEGILIDAETDVKVTGYDLKRGIQTTFAADVAEPGSIVLNSKLFCEIVRSLPDGIVSFSVENMLTTITCNAAEFKIAGSESGEYPELPTVDREKSVTLPQNILGNMIRQTIFAISDNDTRPVYTGELFEIEGDNLTIVAIDGYRMAVRSETVNAEAVEDCRFIVPGAALGDVEKLCGDTEDPVHITIGAKHISFSLEDTVLVTRRLEGEFLNYRNSIPSQFALEIEVEKEDLFQAVSRVSLLIEDKIKNPLRVTFGDNIIKMLCATGMGNAEDTCRSKGNGRNLEIGFNHRYVLEALRAAPEKELLVCINSEASPCVIKAADHTDNFTYMILPVRLKAGT